jgi:hypothetical protein
MSGERYSSPKPLVFLFFLKKQELVFVFASFLEKE